MADHAQLSEERLKLIQRFMGEPAGEDEEQSDPPVRVQPLDSDPAPARLGPSLPAPSRVSPDRKLTTSLGPFLRHHFRLRWPLAALILGVIVGVLAARVA